MFSALLKVRGSFFPLVAFFLLQTSSMEIRISFKTDSLVSPWQAGYCLKLASLIVFIIFVSKAFFPSTPLTFLPCLSYTVDASRFIGDDTEADWHSNLISLFTAASERPLPFLQLLITSHSSLQQPLEVLLVSPLSLAIFCLCQLL